MLSFGEIIKNARLDKGLDQKDVQSETGIDHSLLSRLEKGERMPSREQVFHLADFYKLERNHLLIAWKSDKIISAMKEDDLKLVEEILEIVKKKIIQNEETL